MAALGAQSIASSYEQLLHVDADGGGNSTTHVSVKDGDNGTTFGFTIASDALMMSSTNRLEFGDTGTYIHQSADGVLDLVSDTEIELTATTIDINGAVAMDGAITGGTNITISGELDAATLDISGNADIDGTTNLDAVDIDGNVQIDGTVTVGVDGTGKDVKFFGDTGTNGYMLWDESTDDLILGTSSRLGIGTTTPLGQFEVADASSPQIILHDTGATSTKRIFRMVQGGDVTYFQGRNDDNSGGGATGNLMSFNMDNSDVTLEGDIVFGEAGKGICLGVTSNTDSNTLDDYEEGTFTMALDNTTETIANATGHYVKIGSQVTCTWHSGAISSIASTGGDSVLSGLPFTSKSTSNSHSSLVTVSYNTVAPTADGGFVSTDGTTINLIVEGTQTHATWAVSSGTLMVSCSYFTH